MPASTTPRHQQITIDDVGTPLSEVTFVVVDLETTGGSPKDCAITEIGAVKVRGGVVVGEFQTLVDPGQEIPPYISVLTGITSTMVASAPRIAAVLPAFLEFARGAVLVAHNAPFDLGFLKAACAESGLLWPACASVDTAVLARRLLTRDEVPNCKLSTLAPYFSATTSPTHRALDDARATVDVLHGLLERLGPLGVSCLEELTGINRQVDPRRRQKRHLAAGVPEGPGVYVFRGPRDEPLYVGTSTDLRTRVRSYFSAGEQRRRMTEMVALAERVEALPCAHGLEAAVRELRLIAEHKPRYNRRSRFPERALWVRLTNEHFPRLSVVRRVRPGAGVFLGPFPDRRAAEAAVAAVHEALPLRQCTPRLSLTVLGSACALADMGRCGAPCTGAQSKEEYATVAEVFRAAVDSDPHALVAPLLARVDRLAGEARYEDAAVLRDRVAVLLRAVRRRQRLENLARVPEMALARPDGAGGWELAVVRRGRLVAASVAARGVPVRAHLAGLLATAETPAGPAGELAASVDETELVLRWMEEPGTRLVDVEGTLASRAPGIGRLAAFLARVEAGRVSTDPFADGRSLGTRARPERVAGTGARHPASGPTRGRRAASIAL
ncbi:DEDD exonuclease domain-containing protein [Modestobacter sp. I12A-02628]|uniref:DEDD exonuclease domain-containing protein n=1 Tax=Goekera deserti TaxID=2497753 RepID=A0A7K3WAW0_9ACTN|nr:DEDD exonuclease domain-containing protein [Goekera deserti]MPQ97660.1 DEDD exonuclease domain-containing protein [Goekera deserti]NDI47736.1 DEDD exonuclease domain-containing protein [Goekera deserti]NEL53484.1 DEDD exonuclease domain-containing protein [Goekera deserti]